ncbi:MAG: response regulator [Acidobacteria bacterium]|nr:response regulator [Acidobacteriota bacterium]
MKEEELTDVEILIVEDNPHDLELTLRALRKHNITNKILTLSDGAEALDYFFSDGKFSGRDINRKPRVIFLDLKLPKVDGLEVLEKLRANEATKTIPVVMLTSSTEEKDRLQSYKLGVNSFLVKPIAFDEFIKAVSQAGFYWLALNRPPEDGERR